MYSTTTILDHPAPHLEPTGSIAAQAATVFPFSLNNVTGVLHRKEKVTKTKAASGFALDDPLCSWPPLAHDDTTTPGELRDYLEAFLSAGDAPGGWSKSYWSFNAAFRQAMVELKNIQDDASTGIEHRRNYLSCERPLTRGTIALDAEGAPLRARRFRCWDPACPTCHGYDRDRQAMEKLKILSHLLETFPGCKAVWELVFTLPEALETRPLDDPDQEKRLLNAIHALIRQALGFKKSSNVPIIYAVHPVSDSDLLGRDRWHVHCIVLPCEIVTDRKTKARELRWSTRERLDLDRLREGWAAATGDPATINPEVKAIRPGNPEGDWTLTPKAWKGKLGHALKYNGRGFNQDLAEAVLRTNRLMGLVAAKLTFRRGDAAFSSWQVLPIEEVCERWLWLKRHNKIGSWGFLRCIQHYDDLLKLSDLEEQPPEVAAHLIDAEVTLIRATVYSPLARRLIRLHDELWLWQCPVTGQARQVLLSEFPLNRDLSPEECDFKSLADRQERRRKRRRRRPGA